ncbi:MAG: ARMT1-like domain-containing protein [Ignavibacteriales bacterium]|nr:ARMT1-like domain-containing protein [Ignavibacteriales bacterium]
MHLEPGCIPCIVNQAYCAARLFAAEDKAVQRNILEDVCRLVLTMDGKYPSPYYSTSIQSTLEKHIGRTNLYGEIKEHNRKRVEGYLQRLETMLDAALDRLGMAIRIAIMGNTIDLAANPNFDLDDEMNALNSSNIVLDFLPEFKEDVKRAETILYIADNYEEALFDKFLLRELSSKKLLFAVRSAPIYNDITYEDAINLGIDDICPVIESGSTIAGTDLGRSTPVFKQAFHNADLVIAKGQGNFETLMSVERSIYFFFKVKCEVISRRCGFAIGTGVLYLKHIEANT